MYNVSNSYRWISHTYKVDVHVSKRRQNVDFHEAKLILLNVTKRDEGKYACIVRNAVGYAVTMIVKRNSSQN